MADTETICPFKGDKSMKITFLLPHAGLAGGIRVVAIYAECLKARGHQVAVVSTPVAPIPLRQKIRSVASGRGWPRSKHNLGSHFDNVDVQHHVIDRFRPITDSDVPDADVVIATWWETAEWVNALSESKGAKAYLIQHYETWGGPPDRVDATWRMPMQKIVISRWLHGLARDRFNDNHAVLVPNSVDTLQFHAAARGKQPVPTIAFMYSSVPFKGLDVTLRALELIRAELPDLRAISFGAQDHGGALPGWIEFTLRPAQLVIPALYSSCDLWLCGSHSEGFHLPPLEAMACRCPVVSTNVGGPADIIRGGENGHLVPVRDSAQLAKMGLRVLKQPPQGWLKMSNSALETATSYTWGDATDRFERALSGAIGAHGGDSGNSQKQPSGVPATR
jgi:glycosyltransferase involved in cell wall biosynthesis